VRSGQLDDLETPRLRMLFDHHHRRSEPRTSGAGPTSRGSGTRPRGHDGREDGPMGKERSARQGVHPEADLR
jgi:hypothetical protein